MTFVARHPPALVEIPMVAMAKRLRGDRRAAR
jgi:hypothetical protein